MNQPAISVDERFSDPGAPPTQWEQVREVLEGAQISWISTVRADGRPHVTPLVAVWHRGAAYFTTGPEEQKAVNLSQNPHIALTTGRNDWRGGIDVVVEGRARRVTDPVELQRLAAVWTTKWDGSWQFEASGDGFRNEEGGPAHVFEVRPSKILAFAKGNKFSQTRFLPTEE